MNNMSTSSTISDGEAKREEHTKKQKNALVAGASVDDVPGTKEEEEEERESRSKKASRSSSSRDILRLPPKSCAGDTSSTQEEEDGHPVTALDNTKRTMKVVGATVGASVGKSIASTAVTTAALSSIESLGATAATASLISRAQLQSMGLIALRLPLANTARLEQFSAAVTAFTVEHEASIVQVTEMTAAEQIFAAGFQSNAVATLAAAAVQESVNVVYLCQGWSTREEFNEASVAVALAGTGSLAGGVAGAAVGTLIVPGAGTVIGSLIGSFGGSFVPGAALAKYSDSLGTGGPAGEEATWAALRRLKCIECEDGEWLEVVDQTEQSFQTTAAFLKINSKTLDAKTQRNLSVGGESNSSSIQQEGERGNEASKKKLGGSCSSSSFDDVDDSRGGCGEGEGEKKALPPSSTSTNLHPFPTATMDPDNTLQVLSPLPEGAVESEGVAIHPDDDDIIECGPTDVILFLKNTTTSV